MQIKHPSRLRLAWYRWKALELPWRKRRFVGYDFLGNTFWIFRDPGGYVSANTWRRIVKSPRHSHLSEVKVAPLWHQWLRHVRRDPPTIEEQLADINRQDKTKKLAKLADERWAAQPKIAEMTEQERLVVERTRKILESARAGRATHEVVRELEMGSLTKVTAGDNRGVKTEEEEEVTCVEVKRKGRDRTKELKRVKATLPPEMADPWANAKNPGDNWQPEAWTPPAGKRR